MGNKMENEKIQQTYKMKYWRKQNQGSKIKYKNKLENNDEMEIRIKE